MSFSSLGLIDQITRTLATLDYTTPTPVQSQAIPAVLAGRDVMAAAQTGTGKTAAFALPILQRLSQDAAGTTHRAPRALVLTPTRELAAQVADNATGYGRYLKLRTNRNGAGLPALWQASRSPVYASTTAVFRRVRPTRSRASS